MYISIYTESTIIVEIIRIKEQLLNYTKQLFSLQLPYMYIWQLPNWLGQSHLMWHITKMNVIKSTTKMNVKAHTFKVENVVEIYIDEIAVFK